MVQPNTTFCTGKVQYAKTRVGFFLWIWRYHLTQIHIGTLEFDSFHISKSYTKTPTATRISKEEKLYGWFVSVWLIRWYSTRFEQNFKIWKKTYCPRNFSTLFKSGWISSHQHPNSNFKCNFTSFETPQEWKEHNFSEKWVDKSWDKLKV